MTEASTAGIWRHISAALVVIGVLVVGAGGGAAVIEISGAVIAPGKVVVESNVKRVQHPDGGLITRILVREGDQVEAGALLVALDDTQLRARLAIVTTRIQELQIQQARLDAERNDAVTMSLPGAIAAQITLPSVADIVKGEQMLLTARVRSRTGQKTQLKEQIKQYEERIRGLGLQRQAKYEEQVLTREELKDLSKLIKNGLVEKARVTALRRELTRLKGESAAFTSEIAQTRQAIAEQRTKIIQIDQDMYAETAAESQQIRAQIAELTEQKNAVLDQLSHIEIRAPRTGYVHQLQVHTEGGVIAPGADLMLIVPQEDMLVVDVQVNPTDIDQIAEKQTATLRFSGLDARTTPELKAQIDTLSADLIQDPNSGLVYYHARLTLTAEELARLKDQKLVPGMPVEAFIETKRRTILSYLTEPLTHHFHRVFREG